MNQHGIFDGYGVYEQLGVECPAGQMDVMGFCVPTLATTATSCPPGTVEPWPGAAAQGFCVSAQPGQFPSTAPTQKTCPPGTMEPWPAAGICITAMSAPAGPSTQPCPPGQLGWPQAGIPCTPISGQPQSAPPSVASQCPPGQIGWPQLGIPCTAIAGVPGVPPTPAGLPAPQLQSQCPPGQVGWPQLGIPCTVIPTSATPGAPPPPVVVTPAAPPPAARPAPGKAGVLGGGLPSWALPAALGVGALIVIGIVMSKPKRATPNRRKRRGHAHSHRRAA